MTAANSKSTVDEIAEKIANLKSTVDETIEKTANLKSTVDETTEKIQQMAMFSGIGAMLSRWGSIIFVIAGIGFASKRVAVCLAIIAGMFPPLKNSIHC